jgi:nicotinate-nucleotide--dimethylbenzimidazole phosphoribosyltransferase
MSGLILTAAAARVPVLIDGLPATAAALVAAHLSPGVRAYLLAGQRSGDPAQDVGLRSLGLRPLLDLGITQANGCGGSIALHIVEAAVAINN